MSATATNLISRHINATAAGQTDVDGTAAVLDMAGFDGVTGTAALGAVTDGSNVALELRGSPNADGSASVSEAITPTQVAAGSSNKLLVLDVLRPANRYVFFRVKRAAQNAAIDAVTATRYRPRTAPTPVDGSVLNQTQAAVG